MPSSPFNPHEALKDFAGQDMVKAFTSDKSPEPVTPARVISFAFDQPLQGDDQVPYKTKWLWFKLAERTQRADCSFNAKETDIILTRVNRIFTPTIIGRLKEILDPEYKGEDIE